MKTVLSFISNSSSSSFIMFGSRIPKEDFIKYASVKLNETEEEIEKKMNDYGEIKFPNNSIEVVIDYEDDSDVYVGRSYENIGDDETGRMFKDSVEKEFKEHFPKVSPRYMDFEICS